MRRRFTIEVVMQGVFAGRKVAFSGTIKLKPGSTLSDALAKLGRKTRVDLFEIVKSRANPVAMLDGTRIELLDELDHKLDPGCELAIFQPMAGG